MYFVIEVGSGKELEMEKKISAYPHKGIFEYVFAPRKKRLKKYLGSWHEVTDVLYKGYLFIKTDSPEKIKDILSKIDGYARILCSYKKGQIFYLPLSEEEEELMNAFFGRDKELDLSIVDIRNGMIEKVIEGPLKAYIDKIVKVDLHKRLVKVQTTLSNEVKEVYFGIKFNKISGSTEVLDLIES